MVMAIKGDGTHHSEMGRSGQGRGRCGGRAKEKGEDERIRRVRKSAADAGGGNAKELAKGNLLPLMFI